MGDQAFDSLPDFLAGRPIGRYGVAGCCQKCGTWRAALHEDHIIPKSKGGPDDPSNYQYLCANCHQDKTIEDMKGLRRKTVIHDPERWAERSNKISAALKGRKKGPQSREHIAARVAGMNRFWATQTTKDRRAHMLPAQYVQQKGGWTRKQPVSLEERQERSERMLRLYATDDAAVTAFISDGCVMDQAAVTPTSQLYVAYLKWLTERGSLTTRLPRTHFGSLAAQRLIRRHRRSGDVYLGVRPKESA